MLTEVFAIIVFIIGCMYIISIVDVKKNPQQDMHQQDKQKQARMQKEQQKLQLQIQELQELQDQRLLQDQQRPSFEQDKSNYTKFLELNLHRLSELTKKSTTVPVSTPVLAPVSAPAVAPAVATASAPQDINEQIKEKQKELSYIGLELSKMNFFENERYQYNTVPEFYSVDDEKKTKYKKIADRNIPMMIGLAITCLVLTENALLGAFVPICVAAEICRWQDDGTITIPAHKVIKENRWFWGIVRSEDTITDVAAKTVPKVNLQLNFNNHTIRTGESQAEIEKSFLDNTFLFDTGPAIINDWFGSPSVAPTTVPTDGPSVAPTTVPTDGPSVAPTTAPSSSRPPVAPTAAPSSSRPPVAPTAAPSSRPSVAPTPGPSSRPPVAPFDSAADQPSYSVTVTAIGTSLVLALTSLASIFLL